MNPFRRELFRKVTIIGVGLIGGSMGIGLKKRLLVKEIVGLSQRHSTLEQALKDGVIDHAYQDVKKAVANADLVILATPVGVITGMLSMIGPHLKRNCIVIDVGSSKAAIVQAARQHLKGPFAFLGCHPMAGSEKRGVQFADPDLFVGSLCLLTPTEETPRAVVDRIQRLWSQLGAKTKIIQPEEHDRVMASISHAPHLMAYALMQAIPQESLEYASTGLRDTTRIAGSSPQMWSDICLTNGKNIISIMDDVVKNLSVMRKAIAQNDGKGLTELFQQAKDKRDKLHDLQG